MIKRQVFQRKRLVSLSKRQTAAQERCFVGNDQLSCYPTANTTVLQNAWSRFIWNTNYPLFIGRGSVDVYLFQQDTDRMVTSWTSQDNGAGRLSFQPNDSWWVNKSAAEHIQPNQNISWPFYFVVLPSGDSLSGTTSRLATFTAIQTALPFAIASSRAAAASSTRTALSAASATSTSMTIGSAAAASALQSSLSAAIVSSLRASGFSGTQTAQATATATLANGSLVTATATAQANGGRLGVPSHSKNLALPTYAIVLIAVLGFLAILAACLGAYFGMAALRKRRQQGGNGSHRSSSPIMAAASVTGVSSTIASHPGEQAYMLPNDQAGAAAPQNRYSDDQPFTTDEASRMADAFRNALRNPEFLPGQSSVDEGESPSEDTNTAETSHKRASTLLRDELAAEGKDLQNVGHRKTATLHND